MRWLRFKSIQSKFLAYVAEADIIYDDLGDEVQIGRLKIGLSDARIAGLARERLALETAVAAQTATSRSIGET